MKKLIKYTLIASFCISAFSCSDQETMNVNPNAASNVPSNMIMNAAEKWTMDNIYDNWFSGRQCLVYSQQWSQRNYTEEDRYQIRESVNNSYFKYMYMGLNNFQKVIEMNTNEATKDASSAYGANANQIAAAMIMKVWLADVMTDTWGGIPYSEALKLESDNVLYAKYDDQKELYAQLMNELTEAVNMIDENEPAFTSGDVIYDGDASKWKKFGNSLKCRLAIHMSKVDSNWKTYIQQALASGVMESNDDAAKFQYTATGEEYCKFYEGFYVDRRNDFAINKTLADLLKGQPDTLNAKTHPWEGVIDPRIHVYTVDDGVWNGMAVATQTGIQARLFTQDGVKSWYAYQPPVLYKTYAVPLMTYAELKFIIGEYNGFSVEDYQEGVEASIDYWYDVMGEIYDPEEVAAYVEAVCQNVNAEAYAIQKYIDLYTNGTEAWTEIRRTGYPEQIVRPGEICAVYNTDEGQVPYVFSPLSEVKNDIIARVKYPTDESTLNSESWNAAVAKLQDGTNNYYSKMFWDVRTSSYDHPANK
ncbi:MAG: SusD/RagB family nutrient-binding outer membrane lipoprotein [Prevotella sp.]|nr:SusD/RagB family nutrient-binding outer membrane lipoprotein [Prevotella sp.]